jgi:hypothetical protein
MKQITLSGLAIGLTIMTIICSIGAALISLFLGDFIAFLTLQEPPYNFLFALSFLILCTWFLYGSVKKDEAIKEYLLYKTRNHEKTIRYLKADEKLSNHYRSGTVYCGGRDLSNGRRVSRDESREISNYYFERENRIKTEYDESYVDWLRFVESRGYKGFIKRYIDRKISYYNNKQKREIKTKKEKERIEEFERKTTLDVFKTQENYEKWLHASEDERISILRALN